MKTLRVELPDQVAREIEQAVQAGLFENATEVVRVAVREFVTRRRFELIEQQQPQDIAWLCNRRLSETRGCRHRPPRSSARSRIVDSHIVSVYNPCVWLPTWRLMINSWRKH